MRRILVLILAVGGPIGIAWYGVTGDTGLVGWLNSWQATNTGSYSRLLSTGILFAGVFLVVIPCLFLWAFIAEKQRARAGFVQAPSAPIPIAPAPVASREWGWRDSLTLWLSGLLLILACEYAFFTWDWRHRLADTVSDYIALPLGRDAAVAHWGDGSRLSLQGRLLWDHGVSQKRKVGVSETMMVFVPVAGADWRPGDTVAFVAQLGRSRAHTLQHLVGGPKPYLRVRVAGTVPTVVRSFLERDGAQLAEGAMLVDVADSQETSAGAAPPTFDWEDANLAALVISACWTIPGFALIFNLWRAARQRRLRGANPPGPREGVPPAATRTRSKE